MQVDLVLSSKDFAIYLSGLHYMQQSLLHLARGGGENLHNSQLEHLQQRDGGWRSLMGLIWEGGSKIKFFNSGVITWHLFLGC